MLFKNLLLVVTFWLLVLAPRMAFPQGNALGATLAQLEKAYRANPEAYNWKFNAAPGPQDLPYVTFRSRASPLSTFAYYLENGRVRRYTIAEPAAYAAYWRRRLDKEAKREEIPPVVVWFDKRQQCYWSVDVVQDYVLVTANPLPAE